MTAKTLPETVSHFAEELRKEDPELTINLSNVNYDELQEAINDEYECGAEGSYLDVIRDLYETIGLEDFGIIIE